MLGSRNGWPFAIQKYQLLARLCLTALPMNDALGAADQRRLAQGAERRTPGLGCRILADDVEVATLSTLFGAATGHEKEQQKEERER